LTTKYIFFLTIREHNTTELTELPHNIIKII